MLVFAGARQVLASWSAAPLLPLLVLQPGLFLTLPCPYFTFPLWIPGAVLGRAQPARSQGKAIRLLAQPASPGPCVGGAGWSQNAAQSPLGVLHRSLPTKLAFLPPGAIAGVCEHGRSEPLSSCSGLLAQYLLQQCVAAQCTRYVLPKISHNPLVPQPHLAIRELRRSKDLPTFAVKRCPAGACWGWGGDGAVGEWS